MTSSCAAVVRVAVSPDMVIPATRLSIVVWLSPALFVSAPESAARIVPYVSPAFKPSLLSKLVMPLVVITTVACKSLRPKTWAIAVFVLLTVVSSKEEPAVLSNALL
jgi:hypothetical protein